MITADELRLALPDKMKKSVNQELIDRINTTLSNPDEFEFYRNNLISYTSVMRDGKFKVEQYLDAVRYVSFKLLGATNIDAFMKTFPDKHAAWVAAGVTAKDIASYVTAYNKGKLVNLIFEQTMIPVHVLNMDLYQKALNTQAELMLTAKSEKVRSDAAAHLMQALKPPEVKKVELDIGLKEDNTIKTLRDTMVELAVAQRQAIQAGLMDAQQVAHQRLVMDQDMKEIN